MVLKSLEAHIGTISPQHSPPAYTHTMQTKLPPRSHKGHQDYLCLFRMFPYPSPV